MKVTTRQPGVGCVLRRSLPVQTFKFQIKIRGNLASCRRRKLPLIQNGFNVSCTVLAIVAVVIGLIRHHGFGWLMAEILRSKWRRFLHAEVFWGL